MSDDEEVAVRAPKRQRRHVFKSDAQKISEVGLRFAVRFAMPFS